MLYCRPRPAPPPRNTIRRSEAFPVGRGDPVQEPQTRKLKLREASKETSPIGIEAEAEKPSGEKCEYAQKPLERFPTNPLRRSTRRRRSRSSKRNRFTSTKKEKTPISNPNGGEEDENDPVDFIEIQSAAQWKAIAAKVSCKLPKEDFNIVSKTVGIREESLSGRTAGEVRREAENDAGHEIRGEAGGGTELTIQLPELPPAPGLEPTSLAALRLVCWRVKPWQQSKEHSKISKSNIAAKDDKYMSTYICSEPQEVVSKIFSPRRGK